MSLICDTSRMSNVTLNRNPGYMKVYNFENLPNSWRLWGWCNWQLGIYAAFVYMVALAVGARFMENRAPFKLKRALIGWNFGLAIFSGISFFRVLPEIIDAIGTSGILKSFCKLEESNHATYFWSLLFIIFKIVEFGDTVFVILRKQKLIFLHWYHHATVCMYCWFLWSTFDPVARYSFALNAFVHSIMYFYYGLRSANIKLGTYLPMALTIIQIAQMFAGIFISVYTSYVILSGGECDRPWSNIGVVFVIYFSYFGLFLNFFYQRYLSTKFKKVK
ncbi:putative fatty acid elongation protein 3 [Folsomia candida]|uniref:Elongation of very long chain fatty acids protein n=1 Tax=Folsomia candida TaxID=158441 RepID=A0A226DP19_FOLCA|nr:putative fatty acid elongation protein 3 [Folsomia candida]